MTHSHHFVVLGRVFQAELFNDIVKIIFHISLFYPSSCSPSSVWFLFRHQYYCNKLCQTFKSYHSVLHDHQQINMVACSLSGGERAWFLILSSSQSNFTKVWVVLCVQMLDNFVFACNICLSNILSTFVERMLVKC